MKVRYLLFALLLCFLVSVRATAQGTRLLRQPTVSRDQVAFEYGGDLWIVSRIGGQARRLTSTPGAEADPHFSPDALNRLFNRSRKTMYMMPQRGDQSGTCIGSMSLALVSRRQTLVFASDRDSAPNAHLRWSIDQQGDAEAANARFTGVFLLWKRFAYENSQSRCSRMVREPASMASIAGPQTSDSCMNPRTKVRLAGDQQQ